MAGAEVLTGAAVPPPTPVTTAHTPATNKTVELSGNIVPNLAHFVGSRYSKQGFESVTRRRHVEPLEQRGVDAKEVRGENALGLPAQELPPTWPVAARRGVDTGSFQDHPHRTGRDRVAEPGEFALDPPVTPGGDPLLSAGLDSSRFSAANTARSAQDSRGLLTWLDGAS